MNEKLRHTVVIFLALQFLAYGTLFGGNTNVQCLSHNTVAVEKEADDMQKDCCAHKDEKSAPMHSENPGWTAGMECGVECGCLEDEYVEKEYAYLVRTFENSDILETVSILPVKYSESFEHNYFLTFDEGTFHTLGSYILFASLII